jgi:transcriptional regulator with XRE-family HTH domain
MTQADERTATLSEQVAEEVRALLARRRMSGRQLASQLGVSPSWVSYRLTGAQPIDVNDMQRIADALGVAVIQLLPASARRTGASQGAGRTSGTADLNDSSGQLIRSADDRLVVNGQPIIRQRRHVVAGAGPYSPQRRDATRPVSAIPASRRRPTPLGPGVRPMSR